MNEDDAVLALHLVPNLGPMRIRRLISHFGSALACVQTAPEVLRTVPGIQTACAYGIGQVIRDGVWEKELERLHSLGGWILTHTDPRYPRALSHIPNAPILIEVLGSILEEDQHAIGIVGSRECSFYGINCARTFGADLANARWTVVSGLARGIDTAAHRGALAAKGRTIAVLGSGLGKIYPSENRDLAEKIACHGAVLSEFPVDYPPSPQTFPYRNRIVAGLGRGILVVEAGLKSGALITANLALDYGRQIFSIPGPIDKATSRGTNQLIQDGAKLATCAEDILDELEYLLPPALGLSKATDKQNDPNLTAAETCILRTLAGGELDIESLVEHTKLSVADLSSALLCLELQHRIKVLPGGWYRIL